MKGYVELHCHSGYSFQDGASFPGELLLTAKESGYSTLALTDHDNLCGALEFASMARGLGIKPIIGSEVTLYGGQHITLLAASGEGYSNLCRLLSYSHVHSPRRQPEVAPLFLRDHAKGLIALSGCRKGAIPSLLESGHRNQAREVARQYQEWFGAEHFYLELQQNLVRGDTQRNRRLAALSKELGIGLVATNNVHYHVRERHRLQDCLVAIKQCRSLEETHRERRANAEFYLKSPQEMGLLFRDIPEALDNTLKIAEECTFDLTRDLGYRFPDYPVPSGYNPETYLEHLCLEAAIRRYGSLSAKVRQRLDKEFSLIRKFDLAGFFLIYRDIVQLAWEVQVDLGLADRQIPLELQPPGRGRGSSVSMLVGYLLGLSHIDPLHYNLSIERFLPEDSLVNIPDIDLDFPRNIREELIKRIYQKYWWEHAAITGMIVTYKIKGAVRDLGKALGLPPDDVDRLAKKVDHGSARGLREEMLDLPEFQGSVDAPLWRDLIQLAAELDGFPRNLAQHPGGMIISTTPLTEMVPVQPGGIDGRYICQWDKDAIDQAGFVKIDLLALGALSQVQESLQLISRRTGRQIDLSRIDFEDRAVYDMMCRGDTVGIFQVESAAQMQTLPRLKPRNLTDMAHEVGAVRPGVGVNDGVREYILRRSGKKPVTYDHPLEKRALKRTLGVILFQDQQNQLAIDVAGLSPSEADQMRRAFGKRNNKELIAHYRERFRQGARQRGVSNDAAEKIFQKFNGQYMFPESHAFAFGVTAYQAAWLKLYYPLEFYVALLNQQPMGFYSPETIKEDARRHGIGFLSPDVNLSEDKCTAEGNAVRLGLLYVLGVGEAAAKAVLKTRKESGSFSSLAEFMIRTGLQHEVIENLVEAGGFNSFSDDRRQMLWEVGLRYRPIGIQLPFVLPVEQDMVSLPTPSEIERILEEYRIVGVHSEGHLMTYLWPYLPKEVVAAADLLHMPDGKTVKVAGLVIRRQRPLGRAVFITLEDDTGHIPLIVWPDTYENYKGALTKPLILVTGIISRRDGTFNIELVEAQALRLPAPEHKVSLPSSRDFR